MTSYTFDEKLVSDLHKDARGFRPTQSWWDSWDYQDDEGKQTAWNVLLDELEVEIARERDEKEAAERDFQKRIDDAINIGAPDEDTALRWILDGENFSLNDYQYGADYAAFHFGLSYTNKWRNQLEKITHEKVCELYSEAA